MRRPWKIKAHVEDELDEIIAENGAATAHGEWKAVKWGGKERGRKGGNENDGNAKWLEIRSGDINDYSNKKHRVSHVQ